MRYILLFLLTSCLAALLFVVGDFYNLPLWPVNFLNRTYPLEIQCTIDTFSREDMRSFLNAEDGITIELLSRKGNPLKRGQISVLKTDLDGIFRTYMPLGTYQVRAEIMTYYNDQLYHFATGNPGTYTLLRHDNAESPPALHLKALELNDYSVIKARLDRFLHEGNLVAARALLQEVRGIAENEIFNLNTVELAHKHHLIEQLHSRCNALLSIAETNYIGQLTMLEEIKHLFQSVLPSVPISSYCVWQDGKILYIQPRIEAIRNSLTYIRMEYFTSIENFIAIHQDTQAYSLWLQLTKNENLYHPDILLNNQELDKKIQLFQKSVPALQINVVNQLNKAIEKGRECYETNEIDQAFSHFNKAVKIKNEFMDELDLDQEQIELIDDYYSDIQKLQIARRYAELGDWTKVLELYATVHNDCRWIRTQREDLKRQAKVARDAPDR